MPTWPPALKPTPGPSVRTPLKSVSKNSRIVVTVREQRQESWEETARVEISLAPKLPGFQVEGAGEPLPVEVGILAGDKLFYKHREKFLSVEDVARRALDRALFPKLRE